MNILQWHTKQSTPCSPVQHTPEFLMSYACALKKLKWLLDKKYLRSEEELETEYDHRLKKLLIMSINILGSCIQKGKTKAPFSKTTSEAIHGRNHVDLRSILKKMNEKWKFESPV